MISQVMFGNDFGNEFQMNFSDKNPPRSMERVVTRLIEWGMTERFIINTRHLKIYNWKDFPDTNYDNIYIQDK